MHSTIWLHENTTKFCIAYQAVGWTSCLGETELTRTSYLASLIMESIYGHRVTSLDDEYILIADHTMEGTVETGSAGRAMVDFFLLCEY